MEEVKYIDGYKNGNISYKFVDSSATKNIGILNNKINENRTSFESEIASLEERHDEINTRLNDLSDKLGSIKEEIINEVEGGASDQYDTFKEIEDVLKSTLGLADPVYLTEEELREYGIIVSTTEGE